MQNKNNTLIKIILGLAIVLVINFSLLAHAFAADSTGIIDLTDSARHGSGLASLTMSDKLTAAATAKANNMFQDGYFAHIAPSGKTPWDFIKGTGYNYTYAGENLAIGYTDNQELVQAWLDSPTHRANIMNENYKEIGIAVVDGTYEGANTTIVVQMFGTPVVPGLESSVEIVTNQETVLPTESAVTPEVKSETDQINVTTQDTVFIKDSTTFSPKSIFEDEKVKLIVTLSEQADSINAKIGDIELNFDNIAPVKDAQGNFTYIKEILLSSEGSFAVNVTARKNTQQVTLDLGHLVVQKKVIINTSATQKGGLATLKSNMASSLKITIITGTALALLVGLYLVYRKREASYPV